MAGINMGNMKDFVGTTVYYMTHDGREGEGIAREIRGNGHLTIEGTDGSITLSLNDVFLTRQQRDITKIRWELLMAAKA